MNKKFLATVVLGSLLGGTVVAVNKSNNVYCNPEVLEQFKELLKKRAYSSIEVAWDIHKVLVFVDKLDVVFSKNSGKGFLYKIKYNFYPRKYQKYAQKIADFPEIAKKPVDLFARLKLEDQTAEHKWAYLNVYADILMQHKDKLCSRHGCVNFPCDFGKCKVPKAEKIAEGFRERAEQLRVLASAAQRPIKGMAEIVAEINGLGCVQRPLSNIGSNFYQDLLAKEDLHDKIFQYFQDGSTVTYKAFEQPMMKPNRTYFQLHQNKFNEDKNKIFIFIDDKIENVIAAREAGYIAILFKNAKDLRLSLHSIGLPVA